MISFEQCLQLFLKQTSTSDSQEAEGIAERLEKTNFYDTILECHINFGLCLLRLARFEEAISCFTSVLNYAPSCAQAYYLRGKAFLCLNVNSISQGDLKRALELSEKSVPKEQTTYCSELIQELNWIIKSTGSGLEDDQSQT